MKPGGRIEGADWDLRTPEGIKIEVKAAASTGTAQGSLSSAIDRPSSLVDSVTNSLMGPVSNTRLPGNGFGDESGRQAKAERHYRGHFIEWPWRGHGLQGQSRQKSLNRFGASAHRGAAAPVGGDREQASLGRLPEVPVAARTSRLCLQGSRKGVNIHTSAEVIWGIPAQSAFFPLPLSLGENKLLYKSG
jgi:hypothetical protein